MNWEKLGKAVLKVLIDAGYKVDADNVQADDVFMALSDYQEKHKDMLEYILMQEMEYSG